MTVVVDASIALKWVIEEDGSEEAGALLLEETLAAPDLLMIECANVLWAKARRGALTRDLAAPLWRRSRRPLSSCFQRPVTSLPLRP
jgi:predicted nucleic acid-binding protein